ncbi:MAG: MerR family transcriptional regulator [Myxococcota bacterium]|jgi:DNA-binding transcriptional MerR regulator|nr:MerR family transcriptional regulator [Myxococcota bacterium]
MQYRVEELAAATGVTVDTIRFYQGKGLIPTPNRQGRHAIYGTAHLARVQQIRSLLAEGFSLAQIGRVPPPGGGIESAPTSPAEPGHPEADSDALLGALAEQRSSQRVFSRAELAAHAGVPEDVITAAQAAGLLEPTQRDGVAHYSVVDLEMLQNGLSILGAGLPLSEFLPLASEHDRNMRAVAERGIDLFDDHVRKQAADGDAPEVVADAFRELLPRLTRLVALHFQRTVVRQAMERLRAKGEGPALERALAAVEASPLESSWLEGGARR